MILTTLGGDGTRRTEAASIVSFGVQGTTVQFLRGGRTLCLEESHLRPERVPDGVGTRVLLEWRTSARFGGWYLRQTAREAVTAALLVAVEENDYTALLTDAPETVAIDMMDRDPVIEAMKTDSPEDVAMFTALVAEIQAQLKEERQ